MMPLWLMSRLMNFQELLIIAAKESMNRKNDVMNKKAY